MHCERAVGGAQGWQDLEERLQPLRHPGRHHRRRDPLRTRLVPAHRKDERPRPPCPAIALAQQRLDLLERNLALARYAERQGVAPPRLVILGRAQGDAVVALRAILFADQIVGEAAIRGETPYVAAQGLRLGEVAQRFPRAFRTDEQTALARLDPRVPRIDPRRAREECRRRSRIL